MSEFDQKIKVKTPDKNVFDLSYRSRLSAVMGVLIPVLCKPVVPSDRFRVGLDTLIRLAPLKAPIFDGVKADFHAFFVPNRILDPKWKQFISGGSTISTTEDDEIAPLTFNATDYNSSSSNIQGFAISTLFDYLNMHCSKYTAEGQPAQTIGEHYFNALPVLGYHKIWSDWYRNERIENGIALGGDDFESLVFESPSSRVISKLTHVSSVGSTDNVFDKLHNRNYAKDRFTTALPEPVIGGPVIIPGSGGSSSHSEPVSGEYPVKVKNGSALYDVNVLSSPSDGVASYGLFNQRSNPTFTDGHLVTEISTASKLASAAVATIQDLKTAFKMYSFFMKDTYNGNRYVEFIKSHYNVRVPDSTVDRSIYLGRTTVPIQFGEVFQTSGGTIDGANSLGDYAGRGVGAGSGFLFDETFLEHGYIYIIMSIVPRNTYFQGIDKKFLVKDRFDFFFPEFQNIGDVEIVNHELYFDTQSNNNQIQKTFGYQSRWYDLKQYEDELHGDFLPLNCEYGSNMSFWNFARIFKNEPVISPTFSNIQPINAPFTQLSSYTDNYLIDIQFNIKALRPIMYYEEF